MFDYMAEQDNTRKMVPWNYDGTLIAYHNMRVQYETETLKKFKGICMVQVPLAFENTQVRKEE